MSEGFNFIAQVVPALSGSGTDTHSEIELKVTLFSMAFVAITLVIVGLAGAKALKSAKNPLIPQKSMTLRTFFEIVAEFLVWLGDSAMGKENRKYLPFAGTLFLFILSMNMLGLIPGFVMPTHAAAINAGLAVTVFVAYNFWGIKEVGFLGYLKHMWGPVFAVGFFLFPIEIISHLIRPLSLTLRLFGNMTGDHIVLGVFTDLTRNIYIPVPVVFYFLGTVVCFIQAFVFTLLTMIYIRLAVAHEEAGSGDHH